MSTKATHGGGSIPRSRSSKSGSNRSSHSTTSKSNPSSKSISNRSSRSTTSKSNPSSKPSSNHSSQNTDSAPSWHSSESAPLSDYLDDQTHTNPGYSFADTALSTYNYGFPEDEAGSSELEHEMMREAEARAQSEIDAFDEHMGSC